MSPRAERERWETATTTMHRMTPGRLWLDQSRTHARTTALSKRDDLRCGSNFQIPVRKGWDSYWKELGIRLAGLFCFVVRGIHCCDSMSWCYDDMGGGYKKSAPNSSPRTVETYGSTIHCLFVKEPNTQYAISVALTQESEVLVD